MPNNSVMNITTTQIRHILNKLAATLMFAGFMFFIGEANATTYITSGKGDFADIKIWKTEQPGNIISEGDSLIINGNIALNTDLIINGTLVTTPKARFMGNTNLVILENGKFANAGLTVVGGLTNKGTVLNGGVIETNED